MTPSTGYLGFVHNNSGIKGAGADAVLDGLLSGGHHLDSYDGFLPPIYGAFGFREVARMKFDPAEAPEGWDISKHGRPDVVFMAYAPSMPVRQAEYMAEWDEAQATARKIGSREFESDPPEQFLRQGA